MKVIPIRKKQFLDDYIAQGTGIASLWAGFVVGASVTTLGPALLYGADSAQWWPLRLAAAAVALGTALGVAMFYRPDAYSLLRISATGMPGEPRGADAVVLKKAA